MVLASGTLEPAGDFALLKSSAFGIAEEVESSQDDSFRWKFSCGHVVQDQNFQAICVGQPFDFRYE